MSQITHRGSKVSDFRAFGAVVTEFPSVSSPRSLAETCLSLARSSPRQYKHANLIVLFVKLCNVLEWQDKKIIYRKYASLYFIAGVSGYENELSILEALHHFVESLDKYFGNVCELDLVFNFHKAYYIVDEIFLGGELQETSKKAVEHFIVAQDALVEQAQLGGEDVAQVPSTGRT